MKSNLLKSFYLHHLQEIYDFETYQATLLPDLMRQAHSSLVREALEEHIETTKVHVSRLEQIFRDVNFNPYGRLSQTIRGLKQETDEFFKESSDPETRDFIVVTAAQKLESMEIALYGAAINYATQLDFDYAALLLQEILDEEQTTLKQIKQIEEELLASREVNV
jgi:ferritin-like metal-binding protein YciE